MGRRLTRGAHLRFAQCNSSLIGSSASGPTEICGDYHSQPDSNGMPLQNGRPGSLWTRAWLGRATTQGHAVCARRGRRTDRYDRLTEDRCRRPRVIPRTVSHASGTATREQISPTMLTNIATRSCSRSSAAA